MNDRNYSATKPGRSYGRALIEAARAAYARREPRTPSLGVPTTPRSAGAALAPR